MAALPFTVKHFLVCHCVQWEGIPGPNAKRTLEGVGYKLRMTPGAEPPFVIDELWTFARIYRRDAEMRPMRLRLLQNRLEPQLSRSPTVFQLGNVRVINPEGVSDIAWPLRPCSFESGGLYEFRLQSLQATILGERWKTVAKDFLLVQEWR